MLRQRVKRSIQGLSPRRQLGVHKWIQRIPGAENYYSPDPLWAVGARGTVDLVVHVGAHLAEELTVYEAIGARTVVWIEGDPDLFQRMLTALDRPSSAVHIPVCALVSSQDNKAMQLIRYSNDGASNSVYEPTELLTHRWPGLSTTGEPVKTVSSTLTTILRAASIDPSNYPTSLLLLDVQGHELAVLKGIGDELLRQFSYVRCEVSEFEIYAGGATTSDIDNYLRQRGYVPITERPDFHGDILYRNDQSARQRKRKTLDFSSEVSGESWE